MEPNALLLIGNLSSSAGVIASAIFLTYLVKRALASVASFSWIPVWAYTVVIAAVLTYVANSLLGTLPGDLSHLLIQMVTNAALASGFREWAYNLNKPLSQSAVARKQRGELP